MSDVCAQCGYGIADHAMGDAYLPPTGGGALRRCPSFVIDNPRICPQGHKCYPVGERGPTCMRGTSYYWCGRCISTPRYIAMSGNWARGMYWPLSKTTEAS